MGAYFGTDGIRGVAGDLLTAEFAEQVGRAAGVVEARRRGRQPLFVIGRDTRLSGPMLEDGLVAGLTGGGARVEVAGVIPTPGLAALVLERGADAGVVISASHNPYEDNGIKFFSSEGLKLSDDEEAEIEAHIERRDLRSAVGEAPGSAEPLEGAVEAYVAGLVGRLSLDLSGLRVALDCANGATYRAAPLALSTSGAEVALLCAEPDGVNINDGCGSTHVGALQEFVRADGYDLGFAFDGDGDRVLAVDDAGELVDGDFLIAILATHLRDKGLLRRDTVVTTVMTNFGFHRTRREGIEVLTTPVGDRYVVAEMVKGDYVLGGEQSGHIMLSEELICFKELASETMIADSTLSHYLGLLCEREILVKERIGAETCYRVKSEKSIVRSLLCYRTSFLDKLVDNVLASFLEVEYVKK